MVLPGACDSLWYNPSYILAHHLFQTCTPPLHDYPASREGDLALVLMAELSLANTSRRGPALGDTGLRLCRGSKSEVYAQEQSLSGAFGSLVIQALFQCNVEGRVHV